MLANKPLGRGQFMALSMQHACLCTCRRGKEVKEERAYINFFEVLPFLNFRLRFRSTSGTRFLKNQSINKVLSIYFIKSQCNDVINGEQIDMRGKSLIQKQTHHNTLISQEEGIAHCHLDGILTRNDRTISIVTSELLIVFRCCTKTFLL